MPCTATGELGITPGPGLQRCHTFRSSLGGPVSRKTRKTRKNTFSRFLHPKSGAFLGKQNCPWRFCQFGFSLYLAGAARQQCVPHFVLIDSVSQNPSFWGFLSSSSAPSHFRAFLHFPKLRAAFIKCHLQCTGWQKSPFLQAKHSPRFIANKSEISQTTASKSTLAVPLSEHIPSPASFYDR